MAFIHTSSDERWWLSNISSPTKRPRRIRYTITNTRIEQYGSAQPQRCLSLIHAISCPISPESSREDAIQDTLQQTLSISSSNSSSISQSPSTASLFPLPLALRGPVNPITPSPSHPDGQRSATHTNAFVRYRTLPPDPAFLSDTPDDLLLLIPDSARRAYEFRITQLERDLRAATAWAELLRRQKEELLLEAVETEINSGCCCGSRREGEEVVRCLMARTFAEGNGDSETEDNGETRETPAPEVSTATSVEQWVRNIGCDCEMSYSSTSATSGESPSAEDAWCSVCGSHGTGARDGNWDENRSEKSEAEEGGDRGIQKGAAAGVGRTRKLESGVMLGLG